MPVAHPYQGRGHRLRGFTGRTDAIQSVDIVPRGHRLPDEDAVQGRGRGEGGRASLRDRPAALSGPGRPGRGAGQPERGSVSSAEITLCTDRQPGGEPVCRPQQDSIRISGRGGGAAPVSKAAQASTESLQAEPRFTKVTVADRRAGQPLLPDARQPRQPGSDAVDHRRFARPDLRLLRHGRATLLGFASQSTTGKIKTPKDGKHPGAHGPARRGRLPAHGQHRFRQQPGQLRHREASRCAACSTNPKPESGARLLSPGMFVRIRLPIGEPHSALLVIDRAIGSDQG